MSVVRRLARALVPRPLIRAGRRVAIKAGWADPPPFKHPFVEIMGRTTSPRPHYLWGSLCAAFLARALGHPRVSVIEFGVAGGNGLAELERVAQDTERISGVGIDVYGFDTGHGLPKPKDYRDLPQIFLEGDYGMDVPRLRQRLSKAHLVLGDVRQTVPRFLAEDPAPIGFIAFDLDMYSSTMDAFAVFDGPPRRLLPRIVCYFDDITGYSHSDFTGERLAIHDFNQNHPLRKLSKIYGLRYWLQQDRAWTDLMFMLHAFDHEQYGEFDGTNPCRAIPLEGG
jgi:hypothetical protein